MGQVLRTMYTCAILAAAAATAAAAAVAAAAVAAVAAAAPAAAAAIAAATAAAAAVVLLLLLLSLWSPPPSPACAMLHAMLHAMLRQGASRTRMVRFMRLAWAGACECDVRAIVDVFIAFEVVCTHMQSKIHDDNFDA